MKIFIFILMLTFSGTAFAQSDISKILEERKCQDSSLDLLEEGKASKDFKVFHDPLKIIVSKKGQVFSQEKLTTTFIWCNTTLEIKSRVKMKVNVRAELPSKEPDWGMRLRVRLGVLITLESFWCIERDLLEPILIAEPFFIKHFHVLTWLGLNTLGVGMGFDLTKNLNVFGGVGARWSDQSLAPALGLSLSFW